MNQFYPQQSFPPYGGQMGQPFPAQPMPSGGAMPAAPGGGIPAFPGAGMPPMQTAPPTPGGQVPGMLPLEQSYIENILRLNKGKLVTVFTTFENNREWNAKAFKGIIEAAGRDHVIISDPQTGMRFLIPMVHVDYVTFEEEIEYEYPFGAASPMSTYPPR